MAKERPTVVVNNDKILTCSVCLDRNTVLVAEGNPGAGLVFVGEGPDPEETLDGRPFAGKAGQLLDKMIEALGLSREKVYITNVIPCTVQPTLSGACGKVLLRHLDEIRPGVVVALGTFAAQTLLETAKPIAELRGRFHAFRGAKLMPTLHPADLIRSPELKREVWADLQLVARELGIKLPSR